MRCWLWAILGLLVLASAVFGEEEIPLPEGAVARLGLRWIADVRFSPDGKYLAVATSLGVELRDPATLELVRFLQGHTGPVTSVAFSPDGKLLATGSWDGTVLIWDVEQILSPNESPWLPPPSTRSRSLAKGRRSELQGRRAGSR